VTSSQSVYSWPRTCVQSIASASPDPMTIARLLSACSRNYAAHRSAIRRVCPSMVASIGTSQMIKRHCEQRATRLPRATRAFRLAGDARVRIFRSDNGSDRGSSRAVSRRASDCPHTARAPASPRGVIRRSARRLGNIPQAGEKSHALGVGAKQNQATRATSTGLALLASVSRYETPRRLP
jgi:hypothetical protein